MMRLAAPTAGLGLVLLLVEARETLGGAHSLCFNLTIRSQSLPGKPWCEAQGFTDGKPFLYCDCENFKETPLGLLGEMVKESEAWKELSQTLEEVGQKLKAALFVTKVVDSLIKIPISLQANMCSQREAEKCSGTFWEFIVSGQRAILDTMTMTWADIDPKASWIKKVWEDNQDLTEYFKKVSAKSCNQWFKEFSKPWDQMLELAVPDINDYQSSLSYYSFSSTSLTACFNPVMYICCVHIHILP
ncbi:retinoic acid early transcript 1E-like [Erinaceus europaeus]|uniref:Retinoic acid early transcript 1E-like n=1 Tax=Erinaceus europaeus TaxID=9365 RepID=A0ABM3YIZ6_ERIEU|nr:retinoic acid early transcript 1E-like [Erinaceus europaeus]